MSKEDNYLGMVGSKSLRHISTYYFHVWIVFSLLLGYDVNLFRREVDDDSNLKSNSITVFFSPASVYNPDIDNASYIWIKLTPENPQIASAQDLHIPHIPPNYSYIRVDFPFSPRQSKHGTGRNKSS